MARCFYLADHLGFGLDEGAHGFGEFFQGDAGVGLEAADGGDQVGPAGEQAHRGQAAGAADFVDQTEQGRIHVLIGGVADGADADEADAAGFDCAADDFVFHVHGDGAGLGEEFAFFAGGGDDVIGCVNLAGNDAAVAVIGAGAADQGIAVVDDDVADFQSGIEGAAEAGQDHTGRTGGKEILAEAAGTHADGLNGMSQIAERAAQGAGFEFQRGLNVGDDSTYGSFLPVRGICNRSVRVANHI